MDASVRRSHHHHHHHHYHHYHHHCHFTCHLRHCHFICHHSPALPIPPPPPAPGLQIQDPVTSVSARGGGGLNSEALRPEEPQYGGSSAAQMWQGQESGEQMEAYDYYDEEPVFVLTDEWREFFAKSEAKRKQEKSQAKKKAKN